MDPKLKVAVILASVREGRRGEKYAQWFMSLLAQREQAQAELLDLKEYPLPGYPYAGSVLVNEKSYADETARRWVGKVNAQDAFVVVTPEYNHGYPGALKNAIDHVMAGWNHKPVGFVSYGGGAAGARAVEQLRLVAVELRMAPIRDEVNLRLMGLAVDSRGYPTDEFYRKRAETTIDQLLWWARVMKDGREHHPVPAPR